MAKSDQQKAAMVEQLFARGIVHACISDRQKARRVFVEVVLEAFVGPHIDMADDDLVVGADECGKRILRDARCEKLALLVDTHVEIHDGSSLLRLKSALQNRHVSIGTWAVFIIRVVIYSEEQSS